MDCSTPGFPVLHYLPEFDKLISFESMVPSNYFILCYPLLLLSSIFPSIRIFSNELALCIRWPKYWSLSFSFSISPSNEYSGLISFRIDWFYLPAPQFERINYLLLSLLYGPALTSVHDYRKTHSSNSVSHSVASDSL